MTAEEPRLGTALLHADGSTCQHKGKPLATVHDDGGPLCPAGQPITHVLFNGRKITIAEAYAALMSIGETITRALAPLAAAFLEFGRKLAADPYIRVLAAAAEEIERERDLCEPDGEQNANSQKGSGS
jgi:hypothetical protein